MNEIRFGSKVYLIGPPDSDDAGQFFYGTFLTCISFLSQISFMRLRQCG